MWRFAHSDVYFYIPCRALLAEHLQLLYGSQNLRHLNCKAHHVFAYLKNRGEKP